MTVTTAMQTALEKPVIQPVFLGRLDIASDPVTVWDGPGLYMPTGSSDSDLNGQTFEPLAGVVSVSNVKESDSNLPEPLTITLFGIDLDEPLLRQVVRDDRAWMGRNAWLWTGLLDRTDAARPVVNYPTRLRKGYMTSIKVIRDRRPQEGAGQSKGQTDGVCIVTIDEDVSRAVGSPYYYARQKDFFSSDTGADYMQAVANNAKGIKGAGDGLANAPQYAYWPSGGSPYPFWY